MRVKYFYIYFPYIFFSNILESSRTNIVRKSASLLNMKKIALYSACAVVQSDNILLKEAVRYNTCSFYCNTAFYLYM